MFHEEETEMERIMTAIKAIRNRRAEMNVAPSKKAKVFIATAYQDTFRTGVPFFKRLASASDVEVAEAFDIEGSVSIVTADATICLPLAELVDLAAEKKRLEKELADAEKKLGFIENKLSNPGFLAKAPEKVVAEQREQGEKLKEKIALLQSSIEKLG